VGQRLKVRKWFSTILFEWLLPVRLIRRDFREELARHRSYINEFFKEEGGEEAKLQRPSAIDRWMYVVSVFSRAVLKVCLTWIAIQFVPAVLKIAPAKPLIWVFTGLDTVVFLLLIFVAMSNVALYGPTCTGFVIALRLKKSTGSRYRRALNSYPRNADGTAQLKRWMYTRIYVNLLARAEAREKLINVIFAVFTLILCLSLISYFLTCLGASLIQYNHTALEPADGIWKHIHFYLVTLATIGYGDMTFDNSARGHIAGIVMSVLVIAIGLGFVSYVSYYVINFKERIIAGLDLEAGSGADWIAQSLRDI